MTYFEEYEDENDAEASIEYISSDDLSAEERDCVKNRHGPGKPAASKLQLAMTVILIGMAAVLFLQLRKLQNAVGVYSKKEVVCGKWIDGTPIYRICVSAHNSDPIELKIDHCREIIDCSCTERTAGTNVWRSVPWTYAQGGEYGPAEWSGGFYITIENDSIIITPQLGAELYSTDKMNYIIYFVK